MDVRIHSTAATALPQVTQRHGLILGGKFPGGPAPHALAARVRHWVDFKRRRIRFVLCRIVVRGHPLILKFVASWSSIVSEET
jgi:hypothetical protein